MNTKEQTQLQQNAASITKIEQVISKLVHRVMVLEKENARLRHSLAKAHTSISSLESRVYKG